MPDFIFIIALFFAPFLIFFRLFKKKLKDPLESKIFVGNLTLLSQADLLEKAKHFPKSWVLVKSLSSDHAIYENTLIDLIGALSAKGIPTTYKKHSIGLEGGQIETFNVYTPEGFKNEATREIENYLSDSLQTK